MVEDSTRVDGLQKPLSPEAQLIWDQVRTGGLWNFATLCDVTELSPQRFAGALAELESAHLVERESLGLFEVVRMAQATGPRMARRKKARSTVHE
jgi:hypothetical protein